MMDNFHSNVCCETFKIDLKENLDEVIFRFNRKKPHLLKMKG
jgi:hypothetical protein